MWPKRNRQERRHTEGNGGGRQSGQRSVRIQSKCHTFTVRRTRCADAK
ncbi:hypothetical protein SAMN04488580_10833 [Mycobacterium sp. 283mftsu]|nr:hypothetical protein SAMN04488580_10833 [Mycobacterium sp. 283mftsu]